jgi:hypothetical protein
MAESLNGTDKAELMKLHRPVSCPFFILALEYSSAPETRTISSQLNLESNVPQSVGSNLRC